MATTRRTSGSDCPICCESYKNPKMISCGHSFCLEPCLCNLMQSSRPTCPLCRITIQLPPSGKVEDLPTNFALQSMVEMQIAKVDVSTVDQKRDETIPIKQKRCDTHEEDFLFYCTVCSELLCQKCLDESHDKDHDKLQLQEAVDKYCGLLDPVAKDLMTLTTKSNDACLLFEDVKKRCKLEANTIRGKIDEAGESIIQQVKKRMTELHFELDEKEKRKVKHLEELAAKAAELSLFCECTHSMCEKMKLELTQLNFKRKSAIDSVTKKTTALLEDVSDLEEKALRDSESISFQPDEQLTHIPLGILTDHSSDSKEMCLSVSMLRDLECYLPDGNDTYTSFTMLSANSIVFLFQRQNGHQTSLLARYRTGQSERSLDNVSIVGKISNMSSIRMGKITKYLFVNNNHTPLEVIFNENDKSFRVDSSVTLSNALIHQISAVSWDERGENCYALLSDGETIKTFSFSPEKKETFHAKLEKKVRCSTSGGFHVSQLGMAICDEQERTVKFYETTKSARITRALAAPSGIPIFGMCCPVYVISLQKDKKWYVLWNRTCYGGGNLCYIYQYSASFNEECVLHNLTGSFRSFSFLDEKYLSTDAYNYRANSWQSDSVTVSVYQIKRQNTCRKK